jgi:enoyl-CoA hydratase/carnithine racemase
MDIRLGSERAKFGMVFARRGMSPDAASSWFLPRIVGISRALDWMISGRIFDAAEALAAGYLRSVHPPEELLPAAYELARGLVAQSAPVSAAVTRQLLWRMLGAGHPMEAHRLESRAILSRSLAADATEGVAAFMEKREAKFPLLVSRDMPEGFPWTPEPSF